MGKSSGVLILGCGFTGARVAELLRNAGDEVRCTTRATLDLDHERWEEALRELLAPGCRVLHSIPSLQNGNDRRLVAGLEPFAERVVYLSTTGVYGTAKMVNEITPAQGSTERERARLATEAAVTAGPWSSMVLRCAAIYGPGRGVQERIKNGTWRLPGDGSHYVSRIHVEDLAAIAAASLKSEVSGIFPVADEEPATSLEITKYCANLLGVEVPRSIEDEAVSVTLRADRRVDGSAVCRVLGVTLRYRSYREGIPASLGQR